MAEDDLSLLIGLLMREGTYSGVWFGEKLIEAANHLREMKNIIESQATLINSINSGVAELNHIFELRHDADMRAIARWKEAHPDKPLVWPDHADLCLWLMEHEGGKELMLLNLLAVVHRDGGQFTDKVGTDVSYEAAMQKSSERIAEIDSVVRRLHNLQMALDDIQRIKNVAQMHELARNTIENDKKGRWDGKI